MDSNEFNSEDTDVTLLLVVQLADKLSNNTWSNINTAESCTYYVNFAKLQVEPLRILYVIRIEAVIWGTDCPSPDRHGKME